MSGKPMHKLAKLTAMWASPEMGRPSFWRALIGRDNWALILITRGKEGDPPEKPPLAAAPRLRPEWLRRTGAGLGPEDLLCERIGQYLRVEVQGKPEVDVAHAASIATTAAVKVLAEMGVDVAGLTVPEATP